VLGQTYTNWEALVVDNSSTDGTGALVEGYNDLRIRLLTVKNEGVIAKSRNLAIREAKGRWVAFLDADDWWARNKLEISVGKLLTGADVVYHDLWHAGPRSRYSLRRVIRTRKLQSPVYRDLVQFGNSLLNSSVVVRRDLLLAVGGLSENPRLVAAEDFECWLRIARRTEKFHRISGTHGYYWIGGGNTSSAERTLTCLSELRSRYLDRGLEAPASSPAWLSFALGKANFELGKHKAAWLELGSLRLLDGNVPVRQWVKVAILRCLIVACLLLLIAGFSRRKSGGH
jgi:glycosyltransferase involved in cell wall biosynthesis